MLRNALRLMMFSLLLVAFLPLFMVGMVGFMFRLKIKNRGISATAVVVHPSKLALRCGVALVGRQRPTVRFKEPLWVVLSVSDLDTKSKLVVAQKTLSSD